ncbi:hypothetical protein CYFUS_000221 [Cystobacter fuscus]|uniref:Uncharacterized protein n=1 Tax=Cystobacter fuscus TaxID=43 RepID=A0A250IST8_9BACT|nr:hypothetical protein CYFUS_000221 [Cystobacter fuscus]
MLHPSHQKAVPAPSTGKATRPSLTVRDPFASHNFKTKGPSVRTSSIRASMKRSTDLLGGTGSSGHTELGR